MNLLSLIRSLPGSVAQGLIWGILAIGVYITYKVLDYSDMTVDGGFPLGICLAVVMIRAGVSPILTLPICFAAAVPA